MIINARFLTQPITGVQRYAIELALRIKVLDQNIQFIAPKNIIHKELAEKLEVKIIGKGIGYFWEQIELPLYLKKIGSPLLINLANIAPIFYTHKITTIHDIAFVKFSKGFHWKFKIIYKFLMPLVVKTSKKIITISQFSKKEIIDYYHINPGKIEVIYNGIDARFVPKARKLQEKYILGVSTLDLRKNFRGLIEAYLKINKPNFKLYIIGEKSNTFKGTELLKNENIVFLGRVSDEDLVQYYSDALAYIYPSFYEGFGFPPLEAMACGTAVIVSSTSSLPEVCADAAIYCNPYNIDDIKEKIEFVLNDDNLRIELIDCGLEHAKRFSWEESAKKHLKVFEKVVNS